MFHIPRIFTTMLVVGAVVLFGAATVHAQGVSRGGFTGGNFGAYYRPGGYYDGGYHPAYSYSPYLSQYGQNRLLRLDDSRPSYAGSGTPETVVEPEHRNRTPGYQADLGIYTNNAPVALDPGPAATGQPAAERPMPAEFNVILPGRGSVSFGRFQAAQDSGELYESPHLAAGETYSYQIRRVGARTARNGR